MFSSSKKFAPLLALGLLAPLTACGAGDTKGAAASGDTLDETASAVDSWTTQTLATPVESPHPYDDSTVIEQRPRCSFHTRTSSVNVCRAK